ncbi:hypothetical protein D8M04_11650 [Oceanobacillus piezotolerans]|uniref:Uncharacterized protein n=1 Tax=Oceanobacillus piezotolerans TaxID=2448030 RepID=A0A498DP38_9BACI|nr:hypothetical protein D8M04_11650 [Oceanobacillus piezotolerans]
MIFPEECFLFIREIYRLRNEYQRCSDYNLKEKIDCDINLLSEIIDSNLYCLCQCKTIYPDAAQ